MQSGTISKNEQAKRNGEWGEQVGGEILRKKFSNVKYVNQLIDYYIEHGIPIEVKTCQEFINSGNILYPNRAGRFTLERDQHDYLLTKKGYYLFIVKNGSMAVRVSLVRAKDMTFTKQVSWGMII